MADQLAAVSPDVEARKRALLEAIAAGGTAGLKAFEEGEKALTGSRGAAIDRASSMAGLIGGPEAQSFVPTAGGIYDRGIGNLASARTSFTEDMARRGIAHQGYLDQVSAAVPLVRADTESQLAMRRQALEAAGSGSSGSRSGGAMKDSDIVTDAFGAAEIEKLLADEALNAAQADADRANQSLTTRRDKLTTGIAGAKNLISKHERTGENRPSPMQLALGALGFSNPGKPVRRSGDPAAAHRRNLAAMEKELAGLEADPEIEQALAVAQAESAVPRFERARSAALRAGLPEQRAFGLIRPDAESRYEPDADPVDSSLAKSAGISVRDMAAVRTDPDYNEVRTLLEAALSAGLTWDEVQPTLSTLPTNKNRSRKLLVAEYRDQFPTLSQKARAQAAADDLDIDL